jgi:hypothetical protein
MLGRSTRDAGRSSPVARFAINLHDLKVADAMRAFPQPLAVGHSNGARNDADLTSLNPIIR